MIHVFYGGPGHNWRNAAIFDTIGERYDVEFRELHEWPDRDEADGKKHLIALMNYKRAHEYFRVPPAPGYRGIRRIPLWNSNYEIERGSDIISRHLDEPFTCFIKHAEKAILAGSVLTDEPGDSLLYSLREDEDYITAPVMLPAAEARVWVIDGRIQRWQVYLAQPGIDLRRVLPVGDVRSLSAIHRLLRNGFTPEWYEEHGNTFSFDVAVYSASSAPYILEVHHPHSVGDYGGYAYDLVEWLEASTRWLSSLDWVYTGEWLGGRG